MNPRLKSSVAVGGVSGWPQFEASFHSRVLGAQRGSDTWRLPRNVRVSLRTVDRLNGGRESSCGTVKPLGTRADSSGHRQREPVTGLDAARTGTGGEMIICNGCKGSHASAEPREAEEG